MAANKERVDGAPPLSWPGLLPGPRLLYFGLILLNFNLPLVEIGLHQGLGVRARPL